MYCKLIIEAGMCYGFSCQLHRVECMAIVSTCLGGIGTTWLVGTVSKEAVTCLWS